MTYNLQNKSIGFIGLGAMGHAMANRLSTVVGQLCVYDINTLTCQSLKSSNTLLANSPADIATRCELVFLCLPDELVVEAVLFGDNGLLTSESIAVTTILDASTLDVQRCCKIANQVAAQSKVQYCDCPVSGLPARAVTGDLSAMFGGDLNTFNTVKGCIEHIASSVLYCGDVGKGQLTKAFNNVVYDINIAAFCELLPLAVKSGLEPGLLQNVLSNGSAKSFASEHFLPRILDRQFSDDFSLQNAYKDITNIEVVKQNTQASTPLFDAMQAHYEKTMDAGLGDEPKSAMIKLYEKALGVIVQR